MISSVAKRIFDLTAALLGLIVLSPILLAIALIVWLFDGRPVFFSQTRVGRSGRPFSLHKFRTMRSRNEGLPVTAENDLRVTSVGRRLRAHKLDELPQLFNVLKGEMSLVGPRPEVPKYVALFKSEYKAILTMRPGVTDPASIRFRDEAGLLSKSGPDIENAYVERILPIKIKYNLDYVNSHGFFSDIWLIIKTIAIIFRSQGPPRNPVARA